MSKKYALVERTRNKYRGQIMRLVERGFDSERAADHHRQQLMRIKTSISGMPPPTLFIIEDHAK